MGPAAAIHLRGQARRGELSGFIGQADDGTIVEARPGANLKRLARTFHPEAAKYNRRMTAEVCLRKGTASNVDFLETRPGRGD
jgi:hypothetical protein